MLVPFLLGIILFIIFWKIFSIMDGGYSKVAPIVFSLTLSIIFTFLFSAIFSCFVPQHWVTYSELKLVSLRNNEDLSGNFFLGSGAIGTKQYYLFHYASNNGYTPGQVEANDSVTVFEQKRNDGKLVIYQLRNISGYEWLTRVQRYDYTYRYEFFIPEGSLEKRFSLR